MLTYQYYQGETLRKVTDIFNVSIGFVHHVVDLPQEAWSGHGFLCPTATWSQNFDFAGGDYIRTLVEAILYIYLD